MMKKMTDERLKLKNLKNIRILFLIQNIGIVGILGYDLITKGMDGMTSNPLWFVLMITVVVSLYLSMSISIDYESTNKSPKKGIIISLVVITTISITVGVLVWFTNDLFIGLLMGGIIFICSLMPILYVYYLRIKKQK